MRHVGLLLRRFTLLFCLFVCLSGLAGCLLFLSCLVTLHLSVQNPADSHNRATLIIHLMIEMLAFKGRFAIQKVRKAATNCHKEQEQEVLLHILRQHQDTEYGRDHDFRNISSTNEFVRMQPLTTYAYYQSYIDRTVAGEDNVMFKDPVIHVATSSGTT